MKFRAEIIDCDGYNDEVVITANSRSDAYDVLENRYHAKRVLELEEL